MAIVRIAVHYAVALVITLFAGGVTLEARAQSDGETAAWLAAQRIDTRLAYEQFLLHFANSRYVDLAMERLVALTLDELQTDSAPEDKGIRGFGTSAAPRPDIY